MGDKEKISILNEWRLENGLQPIEADSIREFDAIWKAESELSWAIYMGILRDLRGE